MQVQETHKNSFYIDLTQARPVDKRFCLVVGILGMLSPLLLIVLDFNWGSFLVTCFLFPAAVEAFLIGIDRDPLNLAGKMYIRISEMQLEVKQRVFGSPERIKWAHVAQLELTLLGANLVMANGDRKRIDFDKLTDENLQAVKAQLLHIKHQMQL